MTQSCDVTTKVSPIQLQIIRHIHTHTLRVIVDAVLNNMVEENTWGYGSAGSPYDARNYSFPPYDDAYFFSSSCPSSNGIHDGHC